MLQSYKFLYYKLIDLSCSVIASATKLIQEYGILAAKPVGMLKGTATVVDSLNGGRSATEIVWLFRPSTLLFHSEFLLNIDNCACWMSQAFAEGLIFNVFFSVLQVTNSLFPDSRLRIPSHLFIFTFSYKSISSIVFYHLRAALVISYILSPFSGHLRCCHFPCGNLGELRLSFVSLLLYLSIT